MDTLSAVRSIEKSNSLMAKALCMQLRSGTLKSPSNALKQKPLKQKLTAAFSSHQRTLGKLLFFQPMHCAPHLLELSAALSMLSSEAKTGKFHVKWKNKLAYVEKKLFLQVQKDAKLKDAKLDETSKEKLSKSFQLWLLSCSLSSLFPNAPSAGDWLAKMAKAHPSSPLDCRSPSSPLYFQNLFR